VLIFHFLREIELTNEMLPGKYYVLIVVGDGKIFHH